MEDLPIRLSAFVGRSFHDADRPVWYELRDILEALRPLGFWFEDAKESQLRPISDKVRALINRNDIYIGVLTRRSAICNDALTFSGRLRLLLGNTAPSAWTTSEWVIEEIGFAIGRDKPVILLIEEGVVFPSADLDADTEWISFRRDNVATCQTKFTQMISNLIAKNVPAAPIATTTASGDTKAEGEATEPPNATFASQIEALRKAVSSDNHEEAEKLHAEIVATESEPQEKQFLDYYLLGERARYGDRLALNALKKRVSDNPGEFDALITLSNTYLRFKQYRDAIDLLRSNTQHVEQSLQASLATHIAGALRKEGKSHEAIELLISRLAKESTEAPRERLLRAIASAAQDANDTDLEAAFLEKTLQLNPSDNDTRFRLAYLYGDTKRDKLAAHHYGILTTSVDWPNVVNNLGVAFGSLELRSAQIEQYLKVADRHPLAKANLANLYVDSGFLEQAEKLAREAAAAAEEDNSSSRARHALNECSSTREKESEIISKVTNDTREERDFMAAFADGYYSEKLRDFQGLFSTPHGDVDISHKNGLLVGSGSVTRTYGGGLLAIAAGLRTDSRESRTYHLSLSGKVHGKAAQFELKITMPDDPGTILTPTERSITGLMIFDNDADSIRMLEREDGKTKFSVTRRKTS